MQQVFTNDARLAFLSKDNSFREGEHLGQWGGGGGGGGFGVDALQIIHKFSIEHTIETLLLPLKSIKMYSVELYRKNLVEIWD